MKGLQITAPGQFRIVDVPEPEPYSDEVIVQIKAINSCTHWDLSVWDGYDLFGRPGHPQYPLPVGVPGHELAGQVVARGEQVRTLQIGDRVALYGLPPGTPRLRTAEGYGGYVQYYAAHERSVLPFPEGLSWRQMAMLEMLSCVCQGVVRAGDLTGQRVAVSGLGAAGLMMLQALKVHGPDQLTGIDVDPARCELALALGADRVLRPGTGEWEALREDEFTIAVDCSGAPAAIEADLAHTAGRVIIFSVPHGDFRVPTSARRRGTTVEYTRTPAGRPGRFARHLLLSRQVNVEPLLSVELPVEEFPRGLELLRRKEAVKVSFTL